MIEELENRLKDMSEKRNRHLKSLEFLKVVKNSKLRQDAEGQ
jgi:hypothetical protein